MIRGRLSPNIAQIISNNFFDESLYRTIEREK